MFGSKSYLALEQKKKEAKKAAKNLKKIPKVPSKKMFNEDKEPFFQKYLNDEQSEKENKSRGSRATSARFRRPDSATQSQHKSSSRL